MIFKVALLQILPHGMDMQKNKEKGLAYCQKAKKMGADLVVFPVEWSIGFSLCPTDQKGKEQWEQTAIDTNSEFVQAFREQARNLRIYIAVTYLEKWAPKPRNTVSIINKEGEIILTCSKSNICNFGLEELKKISLI